MFATRWRQIHPIPATSLSPSLSPSGANLFRDHCQHLSTLQTSSPSPGAGRAGRAWTPLHIPLPPLQPWRPRGTTCPPELVSTEEDLKQDRPGNGGRQARTASPDSQSAAAPGGTQPTSRVKKTALFDLQLTRFTKGGGGEGGPGGAAQTPDLGRASRTACLTGGNLDPRLLGPLWPPGPRRLTSSLTLEVGPVVRSPPGVPVPHRAGQVRSGRHRTALLLPSRRGRQTQSGH